MILSMEHEFVCVCASACGCACLQWAVRSRDSACENVDTDLYDCFSL